MKVTVDITKTPRPNMPGVAIHLQDAGDGFTWMAREALSYALRATISEWYAKIQMHGAEVSAGLARGAAASELKEAKRALPINYDTAVASEAAHSDLQGILDMRGSWSEIVARVREVKGETDEG